MKVFLKKDVEKVGMAGEIIKVTDGYARNYLFPRQLAVQVTPDNEKQFTHQVKQIEQRKEVIATKTSMLAERISDMSIKLQRKMHDDGKLYGAISAHEIVEALVKEGISISKSQVIFDKSIKTKGTHEVTIKLTSRLMPKIKVVVIPE
jgi:large subunit ribosomal protein L9